MSWSIDITGEAGNVEKALDDYSAKFIGLSREEFDTAKPSLQALVRENFNKGDQSVIVRLRASGSGHSQDGEVKSRQLSVTLEPSYSTLV